MLQPLLEAQGGDGQNFLAPRPTVPGVRRNKRGGGDGTGEGGVPHLQRKRGAPHAQSVSGPNRGLGNGGKGINALALVDQPVHIDFCGR